MRYALRYNLGNYGRRKDADTIIFGGGSLIAALRIGAKIDCLLGKKKADDSAENEVGYEDIMVRYNKEVTASNFVTLHVENNSSFDISYLEAKINKCIKEDISVGLVLDTKATTLGAIYKDFDFIEAIMSKYEIDFPIYLNIEGIVNNENLNRPMKEAIIEAFLEKASKSQMYVGVYGSDTTLTLCDEHIYDLSDYDCFLVQDKEDIEFKGVYYVVKDLEGQIRADLNLADIIKREGLNNADNFVLSSPVLINNDEDLTTYCLESGLTADELKEYNERLTDNKQILFIPNIFNRKLRINSSNANESNTSEIARGIDISDFQSTIDWQEVASKMDFVIVEVARGSGYLSSAAEQIKKTLNHDLSLGIYFLIDNVMAANTYETQINNYLDKLARELKETDFNPEDVPVFLDFEKYTAKNDYYELMNVFKNACLEHGYTKVGIYGNRSTLVDVVKQANQRLQEETGYETVEDWGFYIWEAGGKFYSGKEETHRDDITLDELVPAENESRYSNGNYLYTPAILQATNVCVDTGAYNSLDHCDVSFLYDLDLFPEPAIQDTDDEIEDIYKDAQAGTEKIVDLGTYANFPGYKILCNLDWALMGLYVAFALRIAGRKIMMKCEDEQVLKLKR